MLRLRLPWAACAAMSLLVVLAGCRAQPVAPKGQSGLAEIKVQSIALMPCIKGMYDTSLGAPMSRLLYCRIADLCFNIKEIKSNSDELMTVFLQNALQKRYNTALVPFPAVWAAYSGLPANSTADTPQSLATALGRKLKADHIMVCIVWRYKERVGTAEASASPASVAFTLYLLNVEQGIPVWEATFDKTQQALSDNLLNAKVFFTMGARWLTADELARYGIEKVLNEAGGVL